MPFTPHDFAAKWRGDTRKERSVSQEHFIDLCRLIEHETPGQNRDGTLVFEAGVNKMSGGQGWADVWKQGVFAWEYKGPKADLDKAYAQLQQYRDSLENPPLLVVSDIQTIVIHTNFVNTVKRTTTLTLDDLQTPAGLQTLRNVFTNPEALRPTTTTQQVTEEAAAEFAKLSALLVRYGEEPQQIAHFLIRLLFCLYAEDTGLLPAGLFTRIIAQTRHRAPDFVALMRDLFAKMATGGFFGMERIKYFNGRLFEDDTVLALDSESMGILERVSSLDWGSIEPSIFGTLFERSLDPSKRSQLGAHYTSRDDIMLIVEPVLMRPLRRRWAEVQEQARALATQRDAASGARRTKLTNDVQRLLMGFVDELAGTRVLDPACGSGNFLYVALRQLLNLEQEVNNVSADLGLTRMLPVVSPEQLYGIEVNEYAHELAQVTIWIGYLQWLRENGYGELDEPILQPLDNIKQMDAILAFDADGKPYEPAWPDADVVIGNPPFLGSYRIRSELSDQYAEALYKLYDAKLPAGSDLVCYWFERARDLVERGVIRRAGLIATQAIRGGTNRTVLDRIKVSGDIFLGWRDRNWFQEGVAVHVSIIGFDDGSERERTVDGSRVQTIFANLEAGVDTTRARRLVENQGLMVRGIETGGPFELTQSEAMLLLQDEKNAAILVPIVNGNDITDNPRGMWVIDFGQTPDIDPSQYVTAYDYLRRNWNDTTNTQDKKRPPKTRSKWWAFRRSGAKLRRVLRSQDRYIVTPRVAKHRLFVWLKRPIVPDSALFLAAREDDYFFGILHSRQHELWSRDRGTQLREAESGSRYTPTTTFETFPFPWPPGREPQGDPRVEAIAEAARDLVAQRDAWLNPAGASEAELKKRTLTNLYNQRPDWLDAAHRRLDEAVFAAYGWPADLADEDILARLLALNLERAAAQGEAPASASEQDEDGNE